MSNLLHHQTLSLEQQLVLTSIRLDQAGDKRAGEILRHNLNWDRIFQIAQYNQTVPHLYQYIKTDWESQVPPEQWSRLKAACRENAQHNLRLSRRLVQLTALLSSQKIECIAFKGPAMALQAYNDLSCRQFCDLDILIRKPDMPRAYSLLAGAGYTPEIPPGIIGPWRLAHANKDFHFVYQGDFIEIHGEIIEGAIAHPIPPAYFFQETQWIEILGKKVQMLSPENTLLMACIQATVDRWDQLRWVSDVSHLCQAYPDLDWLALVHQARGMGMFRLLCVSLRLAEDLGGVVFPLEIHNLIQSERGAQAIVAEIESRLAPQGPVNGRIFGNTSFILHSRERLRDRFYYILDQTFVPKQVDWVTFPLPDSLSALYWLIRPIRLILKFSRKVLTSLFRP